MIEPRKAIFLVQQFAFSKKRLPKHENKSSIFGYYLNKMWV